MHQKATPVRAWMNGLRCRVPLDGKTETVDAMGVSPWSFTRNKWRYIKRYYQSPPMGNNEVLLGIKKQASVQLTSILFVLK